jgi:copper homeostasis protein
MLYDIDSAKSGGADGIVTGVLTAEGQLDEERMKTLVDRAMPLPTTLHRCFDVCIDPFQAIDSCVKLGVARVLTSGQSRTAPSGVANIRKYVKHARGRLTILAGGGIDETNVGVLVREGGVVEVHASLRVPQASAMTYRPLDPIYMGSEKTNNADTEYCTKICSTSRVANTISQLAREAAVDTTLLPMDRLKRSVRVGRKGQGKS